VIESLHIEGFKALKSARIEFETDGLTVLIGPNGAGKSTILEAVRLVGDLGINRFDQGMLEGEAFKQLSFQGRTDEPLRFSVRPAAGSLGVEDVEWRMDLRSHGGRQRIVHEEVLSWRGEELARRTEGRSLKAPSSVGGRTTDFSTRSGASFLAELSPGMSMRDDEDAEWVERGMKLRSELEPVRLARLNPQKVAEPAKWPSRVGADGFGLPAALLDLQTNRRKSFDALERRFKELFPWVDEIQVPPKKEHSHLNLTPEAEERDPTVIELKFLEHGASEAYPASEASSGMLVALTLLWILHRPEPDRILLVEEPENSMHPYLLGEVYSLLRKAARGEIGDRALQVVVSTHSVDFVDLCRPEEIRICERDDKGQIHVGTVHGREGVGEVLETYRGALGELWYSGAIGGLPSAASESDSDR
jgi:predicted ATPase